MIAGCNPEFLALRDARLEVAQTWRDVLDVAREWPTIRPSRLPQCFSARGLAMQMDLPDMRVDPLVITMTPELEVTHDEEGRAFLGPLQLSDTALRTLFSLSGKFAGQKVPGGVSEAHVAMFRHTRDFYLKKFTTPVLHGVGHVDDTGRQVVDLLGTGDIALRDLKAFASQVGEQVANRGFTNVLLRTHLGRPMANIVLEFVVETGDDQGWHRFHRVAVSADWRVNRLWTGIMQATTLHTLGSEVDLQGALLNPETTGARMAALTDNVDPLNHMVRNLRDMSAAVDPWDEHRVWQAMFRKGWPESDYHAAGEALTALGFRVDELMAGSDVLTMAFSQAQTKTGAALWARESAIWNAAWTWRPAVD